MQPQSAEDENRYTLLDELEVNMSRKLFYALVNLADEVIVIGQSEMPDVMDFQLRGNVT